MADERNNDELIADFLAGELSGAELEEFEQRIDTDLQLADELAGLGAIVSMLETTPGEALDHVDGVPQLNMQALRDAELDNATALTPLAEPAAARRVAEAKGPGLVRRLLDSLAARPVLAGSLAAAALVIGAAGLIAGQGGGPAVPVSPNTVSLTRITSNGGGASGSLALNRQAGTLHFKLAHLPALRGDEVYTAWMSSGSGRAIRVGSFQAPGGRADATFDMPVSPQTHPRIVVTRESSRRSGKPSSTVILKGSLTPLVDQR